MPTIDTGDTAWVLTASTLVLVMTPALAFFYGGMVRRKNILSTLNLSFVTMGLLSVQWVFVGYSLAFGPNLAGLIGGLSHMGLAGVGAAPNPDYAPTIPHLAFAAFQMMFAIITPALITGAFVERVRFKTYLIFSLLWATLVYDPVAHWVWGTGGILRQLGALDFAGGAVVHITAGFSALAFALVIKARKGFASNAFEPHNIPYTVLGAGLLWMGWFGFDGGSALAANGVAVNAVVTTNTSAAACGLVWMLLSWRENRPSVLGIVTGAVVGLVAVTPAAGYVTPLAALAIGAVAAPVSYYAVRLRQKMGLDESLDVVGRAGYRPVCQPSRQRRRRRRLVLRQPGAVRGAAPQRCGRHRLCLWHDLCDRQGAERDGGAACLGERGGGRPGHQRARRTGVRLIAGRGEERP